MTRQRGGGHVPRQAPPPRGGEQARGACPKDGAALLLEKWLSLTSHRARGDGQRLTHRKCHLNARKNFTVLVTVHWSRLPGEVWSFSRWRYSRTLWRQSCAMCIGMTLPEQGGRTTQPYTFCDCRFLTRVSRGCHACGRAPAAPSVPQAEPRRAGLWRPCGPRRGLRCHGDRPQHRF